MANSILKITDTTNRLVIKLFADTSETNALKINPATLQYALNANGKILGVGTDRLPTYALYLRRALYDVKSGDTSGFVRLHSDGDAPNTIMTFSWSDDLRFDEGGYTTVINCATTGNCTGNIFIDTVGFQGGNTAYSMLLEFRKEARHFDQGQTADPVAFNRGPARGPS